MWVARQGIFSKYIEILPNKVLHRSGIPLALHMGAVMVFSLFDVTVFGITASYLLERGMQQLKLDCWKEWIVNSKILDTCFRRYDKASQV